MKNNTNIYDIDGELIRKAGDNHEFTIDEAKEKIENYKKKLENLDKNDSKASIYKTYIDNLQRYIFAQYSNMSSDKLTELFGTQNTETKEEDVTAALTELENDINEEEKPAERPATVMDEYVDFEEIPQ